MKKLLVVIASILTILFIAALPYGRPYYIKLRPVSDSLIDSLDDTINGIIYYDGSLIKAKDNRGTYTLSDSLIDNAASAYWYKNAVLPLLTVYDSLFYVIHDSLIAHNDTNNIALYGMRTETGVPYLFIAPSSDTGGLYIKFTNDTIMFGTNNNTYTNLYFNIPTAFSSVSFDAVSVPLLNTYKIRVDTITSNTTSKIYVKNDLLLERSWRPDSVKSTNIAYNGYTLLDSTPPEINTVSLRKPGLYITRSIADTSYYYSYFLFDRLRFIRDDSAYFSDLSSGGLALYTHTDTARLTAARLSVDTVKTHKISADSLTINNIIANKAIIDSLSAIAISVPLSAAHSVVIDTAYSTYPGVTDFDTSRMALHADRLYATGTISTNNNYQSNFTPRVITQLSITNNIDTLYTSLSSGNLKLSYNSNDTTRLTWHYLQVNKVLTDTLNTDSIQTRIISANDIHIRSTNDTFHIAIDNTADTTLDSAYIHIHPSYIYIKRSLGGIITAATIADIGMWSRGINSVTIAPDRISAKIPRFYSLNATLPQYLIPFTLRNITGNTWPYSNYSALVAVQRAFDSDMHNIRDGYITILPQAPSAGISDPDTIYISAAQKHFFIYDDANEIVQHPTEDLTYVHFTSTFRDTTTNITRYNKVKLVGHITLTNCRGLTYAQLLDGLTVYIPFQFRVYPNDTTSMCIRLYRLDDSVYNDFSNKTFIAIHSGTDRIIQYDSTETNYSQVARVYRMGYNKKILADSAEVLQNAQRILYKSEYIDNYFKYVDTLKISANNFQTIANDTIDADNIELLIHVVYSWNPLPTASGYKIEMYYYGVRVAKPQ